MTDAGVAHPGVDQQARILSDWLNQARESYRLGKLEKAEALCREILKTKSGHFDALHLLAVVQTGRGRLEAALASYRKVLALNPNSAEALNNRGLTLHQMKHYQEALASYDEALAIKQDYIEALNNRGSTLRELRRYAEALASFDKALAINPNYAGAYNNKAVCLKTLGRVEEAKENFAQAISLAPKNTLFYRNLADCKKFSAADRHLVAMQELARDLPSLTENEQIELHFPLAKAYADIEQHDRSFHHMLEGNALKRRQIDYDERVVLSAFGHIKVAFSAESMRRRQQLGDPSNVPIFIVGMPRSGTTLVEQILASHGKVFGAGEIEDFGKTAARVLGPLGGFPQGFSAISTEQLRRIGSEYVAHIQALAPGAERITDKMPSNFLRIGLIHLALPNARIVHTRRDPVDTCLSCFSKLFTGQQRYTYDLGELGRYYRAYAALMEHWRSVLPKGIMLEVQYEELVADFEQQARQLLAHCGLEWDNSCLAFHNTERAVHTSSAAQVRQPLYGTSIGRSRPYEHLLKPLLEALDGMSAP